VYFVVPTKLICLDCDSTLSAIEGVDELARLRGPAALAQVAAMTNDAMDGKIPLEQVFARRLEIIAPKPRLSASNTSVKSNLQPARPWPR
jgi:phosphoserine phosphatase